MIRNAVPHFLLSVALVFSANTVFAETIDAVRTAYDEGRFHEAAELAEGVGTAQALSIAVQALITYGHHMAPEEEKLKIFERATALGEKAAGLDPEDPECWLYWAQALGRYLQQFGVMKAMRSGYVGKIRELSETALALEPDLALAHTTLGAWHVEGIKEGGFMARTIYGASKKTGREHFERAIELAPNSKAVVYEYGRGQLNLNRRKNRERALEFFERALELPATNAAERLLDQKIEKKIKSVRDSG